jgi:ribulose-5-phosphate 4-epimerase/fuculose-1-phosphate aldolase
MSLAETINRRDRGISPEEREVRVNLAALYRMAAHYGWTDFIFTHISARVPGPDEHFLINPFGLMFEEVTASNLVKIDLDGNIVGESPYKVNRAGFVIHSAVHSARPDALCVFHSHTRAGMAVSMMKDGLLPLSQHANWFFGKIGYHESEGVALNLEERRRLVADLGDKPILILRNHGTLVAGSTIAETFSMMWHLEKAMQAQLDALATGRELTYVPEATAQAQSDMGYVRKHVEAFDTQGGNPMGRAEWPAALRLLDRTSPDYRD